MKKFLFVLALPLLLIIFVSGHAFAIPSEPPPTVKVWVEVNGLWISVVAPPGDGPYIWEGRSGYPDIAGQVANGFLATGSVFRKENLIAI